MRALDRSKFVRLANKRVPAAIKRIELISNLANRTNYSYSEQDAKLIIKALKNAVAECEARFNGKELREEIFELAA
jgi:hypothetical protein